MSISEITHSPHTDGVLNVVHDLDAAIGDPSPSFTDLPAASPIPHVDDPDYVWDVFYHRAGLDDDVDVQAVNVATLCVLLCFLRAFTHRYSLRTGLPASFTDPYASDSDSEPEDEADEDSNGCITWLVPFSTSTDVGPQQKNIIRMIIPKKKTAIGTPPTAVGAFPYFSSSTSDDRA